MYLRETHLYEKAIYLLFIYYLPSCIAEYVLIPDLLHPVSDFRSTNSPAGRCSGHHKIWHSKNEGQCAEFGIFWEDYRPFIWCGLAWKSGWNYRSEWIHYHGNPNAHWYWALQIEAFSCVRNAFSKTTPSTFLLKSPVSECCLPFLISLSFLHCLRFLSNFSCSFHCLVIGKVSCTEFFRLSTSKHFRNSLLAFKFKAFQEQSFEHNEISGVENFACFCLRWL